MDRQDLTYRLKEQAKALGADLINIGSVERWMDPLSFDAKKVPVYPHTGYVPTDLMPSTQGFIVVAVRLLDGVVDTTTTGCRTTAVQGNFGYV
ncbi:hypothetical protein ACFLZM_07910, partial [Thermodesulfobacteriota bacterium]